MNRKNIAKWVEDGSLPGDSELYAALTTAGGQFVDAEGDQWDFKAEWPFSLSDSYFAGIARLICAFANSSGGIIVFGVHDKKRTGGHNKVNVNLDRFYQAINQLLGVRPQLDFRSYYSDEFGAVDVLLVCRREAGIPPLRFGSAIGKYPADAIWIRAGHEVKVAEPAYYPILFCRAPESGDFSEHRLDGSLPPSAATLKQRFVGRTEVMDRLFRWLEASDEPRTYLHGKGGSGKTTIAYEFARLLKEHGGNLAIFGGEALDAVVFVSAKEKSLRVSDGAIVDVESRDFSDEQELLKAILKYGGWTSDDEYLDSATINSIRADIKSFFDLNSALVVIDDIDTLTTQGIEPGSDFLYRILCRSQKNSKILYTLRNAPTQSIGNAIEVPGLQGGDYDRFVDECIKHFSVSQPSADFIDKTLPLVSERRPLIIESIIALRRTAGSYERAVELFQQQTGDAIRDYVFLREWEALPSTSSKLLLAALSEFKASASFAELQSVLQFEQSVVRDSIGAVREMFLQIDEAGRDAQFSLAPLTKSFVSSRKTQLVGYTLLRERVRAFQRDVAISNPRVAAIASVVERLLPSRFQEHLAERVIEAKRIVNDQALPPYVTEDPLFRVVRAYVSCCAKSPRLSEIRGDFDYASSMKFEPEFKYLRAWYNKEKDTGVHDGRRIAISDLVLDGKRYTETEKLEMLGRKAVSLYGRAQERLHTDTSDGLRDLAQALQLHLRGFRLHCVAGDIRAQTSERHARNTAFGLFTHYAKSSLPWEVFEVLESMGRSKGVNLDPLVEPIRQATDLLVKTPAKAETLNRIKQRLRAATDCLKGEELWWEKHSQSMALECLNTFQRAIEQKVVAQRSPAS